MVSAARAGVLHELEQHVARADDGRLAHGVVQSPQVFMLRGMNQRVSGALAPEHVGPEAQCPIDIAHR